MTTVYEFIETMKKAGRPKEKITKDLAKTLEKEFQNKAVINSNWKLNPKIDIQKISFGDATLSEHESTIKNAFIQVMT